MPLYHTGLWSLDDLDDAFISRPARGWKLILDECQLESHSFDLHANLQFKERRGFAPVFIAVKTDDGEIKSQQTREILIEARRRLAAQRALNLLRACHAIDSGDLFDDLDDPLAIPQDPHSPEDLAEGERESGLRRNLSAHHLGFAAGMAIKASYNASVRYLQAVPQPANGLGSFDEPPSSLQSASLWRGERACKSRKTCKRDYSCLFSDRRITA
jgi:hypothetical protein